MTEPSIMTDHPIHFTFTDHYRLSDGLVKVTTHGHAIAQYQHKHWQIISVCPADFVGIGKNTEAALVSLHIDYYGKLASYAEVFKTADEFRREALKLLEDSPKEMEEAWQRSLARVRSDPDFKPPEPFHNLKRESDPPSIVVEKEPEPEPVEEEGNGKAAA